MYAAKIIGTVVCTTKDEKIVGRKLLVVQPGRFAKQTATLYL